MPDRPRPFDDHAQALLRSLRRRGDLRPGSLIVSIFGDAIAPRGGVVALASLIRCSALFGITERHVRTSVGRLANDGWITAERRGRVSFYSLTESGRRRFAEATQRIYGGTSTRWDGEWTLACLLSASAEDRERARSELTLLGFGQLQSGVLVSPLHEAEEALATLRELRMQDSVLITRSRTTGAGDDQRIASTAWNLDDLARRYRDFAALFQPLAAAAGRGSAMSAQNAFLVRTLLIHEYRRVHLRDPLLPASMLPADWSGQQASDLCARLYGIVFQAAERYLSHEMRGDAGPLPAARSHVLRRFGGLPAD